MKMVGVYRLYCSAYANSVQSRSLWVSRSGSVMRARTWYRDILRIDWQELLVSILVLYLLDSYIQQ